jgi:2-keto-4-pentenoate hydratase
MTEPRELQMKFWEDPRVARGMTAQLAERRKRIASGEKPLGWKIGFGSPSALQRLAIAAPLSGYLMQAGLLPSGATIDVKGWTQLIAEPELGVRLGSDIAAGSTAAAAHAAIASLTPAIEIIDLAFAGSPGNVDAVLGRNIFQRHVVLGGNSRDGGDTSGLTCRIVRRGTLAHETTTPETLTGKLPDLLVHLADMLDGFGEKLKGGDLVICGSIVPPPLIAPDEVEFDYEVEPIGAVSVKFAR